MTSTETDGKLDLIVSEDGIDVFLGNGEGTFKQVAHYSNEGLDGIADFNGDGKLDLLVGIREGLAVRIGNGDGTFQEPRKIVSLKGSGCSFGPSVFVTDFNGDGKADLAYCESDSKNGKIWVALGNGDGTFKKPVSVTVHAYQGAFSFGVGDFNSDGKTDLIANYFTSGNYNHSETDLFLGNGDGTFQLKKIIDLPGQPYNAELGIVPADFNSDGLLDFIFQQPGDVSVFVQK